MTSSHGFLSKVAAAILSLSMSVSSICLPLAVDSMPAWPSSVLVAAAVWSGSSIRVTALVRAGASLSLGARGAEVKGNVPLELTRGYRNGVLVYTLLPKP